jgi:hypothetical protein
MTALTRHVRQLSPTESDLLEQCEDVISQHLQGWIEVANALEAIKANQLYRRSYATFEEYCQGRWSFSASRARQLMLASGTVTNVTAAGLPAPENEGQARALGGVPVQDQPEVWRDTLEQTGGKPTAAAVRAAADRLATVANLGGEAAAADRVDTAAASPGVPANTPGPAETSTAGATGAGSAPAPVADTTDPGVAAPAEEADVPASSSASSEPGPEPAAGPGTPPRCAACGQPLPA